MDLVDVDEFDRHHRGLLVDLSLPAFRMMEDDVWPALMRLGERLAKFCQTPRGRHRILMHVLLDDGPIPYAHAKSLQKLGVAVIPAVDREMYLKQIHQNDGGRSQPVPAGKIEISHGSRAGAAGPTS